MSDPAQRDFRRILIIKPSSPGDIIHALPVLHGLRARFPTAHLAWLVASPFADLISADPALDEVIPFDRKRYGFLGRSIRITAEFFTFLRTLRAKAFDLTIDLQGLFRSGFLARASGAPTRIGFSDAREFAWLFYTDAIAVDDVDIHAADKNYAVSKLLGFADQPMDFSVHLTAQDRAFAADRIASAGISSRFAVLVPGTRWETKRWDAIRFGRLAALLKAQANLDSILVGGADDVAAAESAVQVSGGAAMNLCGQTTLRQAAALIENSEIVITADSTPMHLAAAFGRPLVALFGPTNPRRTGPYGRTADVLRMTMACSPCYFRRLRQCPHDHACMRDLTVESIGHAALARLPPSP